MSRLSAPLLAACLLMCNGLSAADPVDAVTPRPPGTDQQLRHWLVNMVGCHRYSPDEVAAATGLSKQQVQAALERFEISRGIPFPEQDRLFVLPYPGGRHPRIGFLEGAVDPQRETKVSVFTPWHDPAADKADYVVVDAPEAIWSNLGLTYLAHTHVPTIWSKQGIAMEPLEWEQHDEGTLSHTRRLPNGIAFTSRVEPRSDHVRMQMSLTNDTDEPLSDLRVQMCVMLKGAAGFTEQTNDNKLLQAPYSAAHDPTKCRWIITAWLPNQRTWANQRCPCLHSDPQFPDCQPGQTKTIDGWLSFYEGTDIQAEIARIENSAWWEQSVRREEQFQRR